MKTRILQRAARYVVITPARDEAQYIEDTIRSVLSQTITPAEWVIVDDGSTDGTASIIDRLAVQYPWITAVHRPNRGFRRAAIGVMEAFDEGLNSSRSGNWDYLVKLDGDLQFESDFFEKCFHEFASDERLGIGGGKIYQLANRRTACDPTGPPFHVRGATKIYRRECWDAIAGLVAAPGWDTIDELKANMLGWRTRTFLQIGVEQKRATGARDGSWKNSFKDGRADYVTGYHPVFVIAKCLKRLFRRPFLVGCTGIFFGFLSGYFGAVDQVADNDLVRYVRKQQLRRLLLQDSIWK